MKERGHRRGDLASVVGDAQHATRFLATERANLQESNDGGAEPQRHTAALRTRCVAALWRIPIGPIWQLAYHSWRPYPRPGPRGQASRPGLDGGGSPDRVLETYIHNMSRVQWVQPEQNASDAASRRNCLVGVRRAQHGGRSSAHRRSASSAECGRTRKVDRAHQHELPLPHHGTHHSFFAPVAPTPRPARGRARI